MTGIQDAFENVRKTIADLKEANDIVAQAGLLAIKIGDIALERAKAAEEREESLRNALRWALEEIRNWNGGDVLADQIASTAPMDSAR